MKLKREFILTVMLLFVFIVQLMAQVKLPAIFSDHMVLQCNKDVAIWGHAQSGAKVTVKTSWNNAVKSAVASNDGYWKIMLNTPKAGGPYTLVVSDGHPVEIKDVLIGEVWLCSGQSNMSRPMKPTGRDTIQGATEEFKNAHKYNIRYFEVGKGTKLEPQADVEGSWRIVSAESLPDMSATSWFFGKALQESLKVPIGLITSSWGGSKIEAWMSSQTLSAFPKITVPEIADSIKEARKTPTILYNNMIYPIIGYGIQGVIWYQGEANIGNPLQYEKLLPAMVSDWRKVWNTGNFAFYYLQIAPYYSGQGPNSAYFRESQLKIKELISNSGIGFLTDAGEEKNIHPSNKKAAGDRLAFLALAGTYGLKGITATGPVYKSMKVQSGEAFLSFYNAAGGLTSNREILQNFEIAGADRVFYPAEATIIDNQVVVSNREKVQSPVAVRYAFKAFVKGDLFNKQGLPASSFRTDNWTAK